MITKYDHRRAWFAARREEGVSYLEIGRLYGVEFGEELTRNTVAGAIRRLGLSQPGPQVLEARKREAADRQERRARERQARNARRRERRAAEKAAEAAKAKRRPAKFWPLEPFEQEGRYRPVGILEVRHDQCRFAIQDKPFLMCGAKAIRGMSWCPEHQKRVFHKQGAKANDRRLERLAAAATAG